MDLIVMGTDKVQCKKFSMLNMSIAELFGKSPKIKYICGNCDGYNETRIPMGSIKCGRPYAKCNCCGIINVIPIHIDD